MDRLESLGTQLSQITMYDIKSYYNQAKNMVLNVSEMEAKVREATNEDPWGASSTLMQEIAQGTFNFQQFNEIMPCIYSRFMEKEAKQWREIYKALQLLEYIIKHGSERVVDDARSHLSTIKMLRNFHYIDDKGKDQGINVRNRSSEIAALLSDLDKIRTERRKAKANRNKYTGTGNDGMMGFSGSSGRYGGFGNEGSYGGSGGGYSGDTDYYNGGGGSSSSFRDDAGRKGYEEYDAGDYEETPASRRSNSMRGPSSPSTSRVPGGSANSSEAKTKVKEKEKEKPVPVDDLLGDWGDDSGAAALSATASIHDKALPALVPPVSNDGDDFDDFQSAPVSPPPAPLAFSQTPMQTPAQGNAKPNLFDILNPSTPTTATSTAPVASRAPGPAQQSWPQSPLQAQTARPNYFGGSMGGMGSTTPMSPVPASFTGGASTGSGSGPLSPTPAGARPPPPGSAPPAAKSNSNFDDLWSLGLGASAKAGPGSSSSATAGKSMKDLEREKAQAGIWGASQGQTKQASVGAFGAFGSSSVGGSSGGGGGGDDLLL